MTGAEQAADDRYAVGTGDGDALPLVVEASGRPGLDRLRAWLGERREWVQDVLVRHGALLLRGFAVTTPQEFEAVALAIAPRLRRERCFATGERLTEHVFPSSDVSGWYPIPQHCELSFLREPPSRIFFGCLEPPAQGGETPLADFRKVWRDLDPDVRERFERGGIRVVRHLRGPDRPWRGPWALERWDEVLARSTRAEAEALLSAEGIASSWTPDGGLRLELTPPVSRVHPRTGERVWYNLFAARHLAAAAWDYERILRRRPSLRHRAGALLVRATLALKRRSPETTRAFYCTYRDGREVPEADMRALWDTLWRHMVFTPWRRGDFLAIDNHAVSHGRMPFSGPRRIVACLA